ncbi:MAG: HD-GYP domain-containing protein [Chloroflexota bacterium]|nr:HD-GYP domain-containing protein [Chloroflexota bacterium]
MFGLPQPAALLPGLPRPAALLWLLVVSGASVVLLASFVHAAADPKILAAACLFVLASAIAQRFMVPLPTTRPGHRTDLSVGAAINVAAVLLFPMHWSIPIVSLGMLCGKRGPRLKLAYNVGQAALSAASAGVVWRLSSGSGLSELRSVPFILAACCVYFLSNSVMVAAIVALASALPLRLTWIRTYRHTWPATLGVLFVGVLIAILYSTSAWTIALAAIPLTALYYTLRNTVSLETNTVEALFQLADILDARDSYTHGHSLRVGQYAEKLALALGISGDEAHLIFLAGRLHDIGKCAIRNEVLLKPGALNDEEREHMCIHPAVGGSMLASFSLFKQCARYVRGHHERWDGGGYPDRLAGEAIPLGARIIAVVDAFDAMTTTRPYRKALPLAEARRRLTDGAGTQWDPRIVAVFLELLATTPLAEQVPLTLPTGVGEPTSLAA